MRLRPRWPGWPDAAGMSKARLVITAVTVEKRPVSEVARFRAEAIAKAAARRLLQSDWARQHYESSPKGSSMTTVTRRLAPDEPGATVVGTMSDDHQR